jgi:hypothetical protein
VAGPSSEEQAVTSDASTQTAVRSRGRVAVDMDLLDDDLRDGSGAAEPLPTTMS